MVCRVLRHSGYSRDSDSNDMISLEQLQSGIVLSIDKPRQWSSFQAVNKIKAVVRNTYGLKKFKIGHAGTLDPLASGLLLVCVGKATKSIPILQDGDKEYTGTMVLGATTPCYDLEREIDRYYPYEHITAELLEQTRRKFEGEIMQVPPMFSAVKIDGQRAYEYAREDNPDVTIKPKPVKVYSFEITNFRPGTEIIGTPPIPNQERTKEGATLNLYKNPLGTVPEHLPQVDFRIRCGKGTYIRSLARDFGQELGSGAFLATLRRTRIGDYSIEDAVEPQDVEKILIGK